MYGNKKRGGLDTIAELSISNGLDDSTVTSQETNRVNDNNVSCSINARLSDIQIVRQPHTKLQINTATIWPVFAIMMGAGVLSFYLYD